MMIRVVLTSLMAGFLAGVLVAGVQHVTTTPLILAAEVFENQASNESPMLSPAVYAGEARLILAHAEHDAVVQHI